MKNINIGKKFYFGVLAVFLVFAVAFIFFQQAREKQYKIDTLDVRLQGFNGALDEWLRCSPDTAKSDIDAYVARHDMGAMRVTIIRSDGTVTYDSDVSDVSTMGNHRQRPEVEQALGEGSGASVARWSTSKDEEYYYSATYFADEERVIRSALPYNNDLARALSADQHYIWFAVVAMIILTAILYRFFGRLGDNITKLRIFARRAAHNESLDTEDLAEFPDDELGEIAERIIKIYKNLQSTRQEQDILKRQLTQNVAHELKTPVASIQGYLETVLENPQIGAEKREQFLRRCFAQSQRLSSLLQDISTLNRMDDAPDVTSFVEVDVARIVADIARETALQLQARRMTLLNRLPAEVTVRGNQSLIYSIFRNLTDNAIAYAGEGTTVTIEAHDGDNAWRFTFRDNGVGVAAEHLPRLFERFYRVDKGRSRKMGGTGLGLAIVKNAVLLHGGTITVSNDIAGGLSFAFTLAK